EDLRPPGRTAREPDRSHRSLGSGRGEPDHLDTGHAANHLRRELDLRLCGSTVARTPGGGRSDRLDHLRMRVPQDQRSPRADIVEVPVAVDVDELGAVARLEEDRVPAHRPHCAHRAVHATRYQPARAIEELLRTLVTKGLAK